VDGGDSIQVWRVAANIVNNQSRTAHKGWFSSVGVGEKLTPHHNEISYEMLHKPTGLELSRQRKMDMTFGTWNVRSPYRTCSLETVASELAKYNSDLVAVAVG
jgi:hypothetical protein